MKIIKPMTMGLLHKPYQQAGRQHLVVAALGFFKLGGVPAQRLLPEAAQWPVLMAALPAGQPFDEVMPKGRGEVLVLGQACAPQGRAAAAMPVRLQLWDRADGGVSLIDKCVQAMGLRTALVNARGEITLGLPQPCTQVPLGWAQACGGLAQGPVAAVANTNTNTNANTAAPGQGAMPQLEFTQPANTQGDDGVASAAMGPQPIDWGPRRRFAGTYDEAWVRTQHPGLPLDLDWRLYNRASPDQWLARPLRGGEAYALHGMHPQQAVLRGRLPALRVRAFVLPLAAVAPGRPPEATGPSARQATAAMKELPLHMDTVWFLPEAGLGIAVWRGQIEVADSDALDVQALMLAYEDASSAPRSAEHYAEVLRLRLDPETAALSAFNEGQLAPPAAEALLRDLAARDVAHAQQMQQRQQAMSAALQQEMQPEAAAPGEAAAAAASTASAAAASTASAAAPKGATAAASAETAPAQAPQRPAILAALAALQPPGPSAMASGDVDLNAMVQQAQAAADQVKAWGEQQRAALGPMPAGLSDPARATASTAPAAQAKSPSTGPAGQAPTWPTVLQRARVPLSPLEARARRAAPTPVAHAAPLPPELAARLGQQVLAWHAAGQSLAGRDLSGVDLRAAPLAGADLRGCMLEHADLRGARLQGCDLREAVLTAANLAQADCSGANFTGANLCASQAQGARLRGASLSHLRAHAANWSGVDATGAVLSQALLDEANLSHANFSQARLEDCVLNQAKLPASRWQGAHFRRCVGWQVQAEGADFSGSDWQRSALVDGDLRGSRWQGARLSQMQGGGSDWSNAQMTGVHAERCAWPAATMVQADLADGRFIECDFSRADLSGARLSQACLARSLFMQTQLPQADAAGADFFQALLRKATLQGADLRQASLYQAEMTGANFTQARVQGLRLDALRSLA